MEIDECIAFWRVLGEGPEVVKSLGGLLIRRAKYLAKTLWILDFGFLDFRISDFWTFRFSGFGFLDDAP